MSVWAIKGRKYGDLEQISLEKNIVAIEWNELPDLSKISKKEELDNLYLEKYPNVNKKALPIITSQIWRFLKVMQKGDLVVLPLQTQSLVVIGEVIGDYEYKVITPNIKHIRPVKWLKTIPRSSIDQNILNTLSTLLNVFKLEKNNAENYFKELLKGEILPDHAEKSQKIEEERINIEEIAKDQIIKYVESKFKGHNLTRLIQEILNARGYITWMSPPGPDGGVDILAAPGPLGFDRPRICVQVKSWTSPVGVNVVHELMGVMKKTGADQGLLVAWGGLTVPAKNEAKSQFFTIRVWDQGDIIEEIFKNYDKFSEDLQAELPLKRIWTLVNEEE